MMSGTAKAAVGGSRGLLRVSTSTTDSALVSIHTRDTEPGERGPSREEGRAGNQSSSNIASEANPRGRAWAIPDFILPSGKEFSESPTIDVGAPAVIVNRDPDQDGAAELAEDMQELDADLSDPNNELSSPADSSHDPSLGYSDQDVSDIYLGAEFPSGQPSHAIPLEEGVVTAHFDGGPLSVSGAPNYQAAQQATDTLFQSFGLDIIPIPITVPGRVLPKPNVIYSTNTAVVNDDPWWNITQAKFIAGARLECWAVLVINNYFAGSDDLALRDAVNSFRARCNQSGMHITTEPTYTFVQLPSAHLDPTQRPVLEAIKTALFRVKPKPDLVMAVLPGMGGGVYERLKYLCDVILDVPTICVLSFKFCRSESPGYSQYLSGLALKLNVKLGGTNHRLAISEGRTRWLLASSTMVMGMCVSHPGPGSLMGTPSVAAVVASVDSDFVHYLASLSIQNSNREIITDLTSMMIERLMVFQKRNNGTLPERILIYRGGLSENHFHLLQGMETKADDSRLPEEAQAWFWTEEEGGGNPPAGTVVDRGVMPVYDFDFYLQAHGGVNGTARPVLYTVVYDENRVKADVIQETTHMLSYMYAPATQAVSWAAPIQYAKLAMKRGRCYLRELDFGYLDGDLEEQNVMEEATRLWHRGGSIPGRGLSDTMFYI